MCPTSPVGPPVDVGMRIDVASIDMVSEVNMVSGLATGPAAGLTQMRNGPVPVPSAFRWRSPRPGPWIPLRARSPLWHTHTLLALVCIFDTHTHGLLRCSGGNVLRTIWGRTVTVAPAEPVGRSQRYFRWVSFGVERRRAPPAGGRAACTRGSPHGGPRPPTPQARSRQPVKRTHPRPATKHPSTQMRFHSVPSLFPGSSTPSGRSNRLRQRCQSAQARFWGEACIVPT